MTTQRTPRHLTIEEIEHWHRGKLPAGQIVALARHLATCRQCEALAEPHDLERNAAIVRAQVEGFEHPDLETALFAYVDGTLDERDRSNVGEHLLTCSRCREDVEDARGVSRRTSRTPSRAWLIALAALLATAFIGALLLQPRHAETAQPQPTASRTTIEPKPRRRVDEAAMVRRTLVEAPLVMPPILRSIRRGDEVLRGSGSDRERLSPAGVVVEARRPELTWSAPEGATSFVAIYDGEREIVRSRPMQRTSWTPPADLERGVTYTWEVQIQTSGGTQIVPAPPAPAARFHVLDARVATDLDAARRQRANDPLLLGILYARAGLEARARAELAQVPDAEREIAQRRLREIDSWRR